MSSSNTQGVYNSRVASSWWFTSLPTCTFWGALFLNAHSTQPTITHTCLAPGSHSKHRLLAVRIMLLTCAGSAGTLNSAAKECHIFNSRNPRRSTTAEKALWPVCSCCGYFAKWKASRGWGKGMGKSGRDAGREGWNRRRWLSLCIYQLNSSFARKSVDRNRAAIALANEITWYIYPTEIVFYWNLTLPDTNGRSKCVSTNFTSCSSWLVQFYYDNSFFFMNTGTCTHWF